MYTARQAIAAEIENQVLQECSDSHSLSPQRNLFDSYSSYSSNDEEFQSRSQLQSNGYCIPYAAKPLDVHFSTTSDGTYRPPLQDITSLDDTKSMMLLSTKLPNNATPQTLTEEQFSPRKLCSMLLTFLIRKMNLKAKFHL